MRPERGQFIMKDSRVKKLMPYCLTDSITAQKYKQFKDVAENEFVKEKEVIIDVITPDDTKKSTPPSTVEMEDKSKSRESKLSVSSSTERTSDDEENTDGKPSHSYISLIANAILSVKEKRLVLSDIYQYVLDTQPYFRNKAGQGWRNSIRHNLSLNECFIKAGRSPNGKGHFWAINPANYDDFSKGDFRRRRAQRRARRAMAFGDLVEHFSPYWSYSNYPSTHQRPNLSSYAHLPAPTSYRYSPYYPLPASCKPTSSLKIQKEKPPTMHIINKPIKPTPVKRRAFDIESLLRDDDIKTERTLPEKIAKRPSSTEISPPLPVRISPYARLNMDYLADKHVATPLPLLRHSSSHVEIAGTSSLYERYHNQWNLAPLKSRPFLREERYKL